MTPDETIEAMRTLAATYQAMAKRLHAKGAWHRAHQCATRGAHWLATADKLLRLSNLEG